MPNEIPRVSARKRRVLMPLMFVTTVVVGLAVRPFALSVGPAADDFAQLGMLEGHYPVQRSVTDLFDFTNGTAADLKTLVHHGFFPWWSHPELRLSMWRPLSSLLMWLDVHTFGKHYMLYHVHSFVWWAALAVAVGTLWQRILTLPVVALALALFALDEAHGVLIAWIANRNATTSSFFGVLALLTHVAGRRRASHYAPLLTGLSFAIALGFGEYALTLVGYFVAYEWLASSGPVRRRILAMSPVILPTLLFLILRRWLGYGPLHSGIYVDPLSEPLAFGIAALQRIPVFIADLSIGLRADYWTFGLPWTDWLYRRGLVDGGWLSSLAPWRRAHQLIGVATLVLHVAISVAVLRRRPRTDPLWWLSIGSALALIPAAAPFPSSRLLVAALIGVCPVFATFIWEGLRNGSGPMRAIMSLSFGLYQLTVPAWHTYTETHNLQIGAEAIRREVRTMEVDDRTLPRTRVIVLNAVDAGLGFYIPLIRQEAGLSAPERCWVVSGSPTPMNIERVSPNAFDIEYLGGQGGTGSSYEQMFRSQTAPLRKGELFDLDGMRIEILEVHNGGFTRARFALDRPLEDPSFVFVYAGWKGLRRFAMPRFGQSVRVEGPIPAALVQQ